MAVIGSAEVELVSKSGNYARDVEADVKQATEGAAKQGEKAVDSLGAKMATAFGAGLVVSKVKDFFASAIDGASDLSESIAKSQVVFGDSSAAVEAFAKTADTAIGQSEAQALAATGTFGNLFRSLQLGEKDSAAMSTSLVQLAGDLASFNNVDATEALDALRAGLVGEAEPLKRFGVNMNEATLRAQALKEGLIATEKEALTPAVKAQAAYGLILEQTSLAQGDFARTSGGLANQQRILNASMANLQASIGKALVPAMTALVSSAGAALKLFELLPGPVRNVGVVAVVAGVGIAAAAIALKNVEASLLKIAPSSSLAAGGLSKWVAGAAAAVAVGSLLAKGFSDFSAGAETLALDLQHLAGLTDRQLGAVGIRLLDLARLGVNVDDTFRGIAEQSPQTATAIIAAMDRAGTSTELYRDVVNRVNAEKKTAKTREDEHAAATDDAATSADEATKAYDRYKTALDRIFGGYTDTIQAAVDFEQAQVDLKEEMKESGTQIGTATQKQRDLTDAFLRVIAAAGGEKEALTDAGLVAANSAGQTAYMERQLDLLQKRFPQLTGPLDTLRSKVREAGAEAETTGTQIGTGLEAGIRKGLPGMVRAIEDVVAALHAAARGPEALRAQSPSELFAEVGEDIDAGLAKGVTDSKQVVLDALGSVLTGLEEVARSRASSVAGALTEGLELTGLTGFESFGVGTIQSGEQLLQSATSKASEAGRIADDITKLLQAGVDVSLVEQAAGNENLRRALLDAIAGGFIGQINEQVRAGRAAADRAGFQIAGVGGADRQALSDAAKGIATVTFGPGSVVVTFEGVVPTTDEARRTGITVGQAVADVLSRNSVRQAVRGI